MTARKTKRPAHRNGQTHMTALRAMNAHRKDYLVPTATVFGTSLLAATGLILKTQLLDLMRSMAKTAASESASVVKALSLDSLLAYVGLERRRGAASAAMPWFGGIAAGMIAGSALGLWLIPTLKRSARDPATPDYPDVPRNSAGNAAVESEHLG